MTHRKTAVPLTLLVVALSGVAPPAHAKKADPAAKAVKTLVGSVRYSKDALAIKQMDTQAQGEFLLGEAWPKATAEQRSEFARLFGELFAAIAFPRIRKNFEHLETILYEPAAVKRDRAQLGSTIVILHALKNQEIRVTYDLRSVKKKWRVVDVTVAGDKSMLTNVRNDQVQPIFSEGGWDKLLGLMRERLAQQRSAP